MSRSTFYCRECRDRIGWEQVVTTESGTFHELGPVQHPVAIVADVDVAAFFDDGMLWLTVLEAFTEGKDPGGLLRDLADSMGTLEVSRMQIKGGYNVGAIMLTVIAGLAGVSTVDAAGLIRGIMLDQRMEAGGG